MVSRHGRQERVDRRRARDAQAALGEQWLLIRETGAFVLEGCASWGEYRDRVIVPQLPARWGFSPAQACGFVDESIRLARLRRLGQRGRR